MEYPGTAVMILCDHLGMKTDSMGRPPNQHTPHDTAQPLESDEPRPSSSEQQSPSLTTPPHPTSASPTPPHPTPPRPVPLRPGSSEVVSGRLSGGPLLPRATGGLPRRGRAGPADCSPAAPALLALTSDQRGRKRSAGEQLLTLGTAIHDCYVMVHYREKGAKVFYEFRKREQVRIQNSFISINCIHNKG